MFRFFKRKKNPDIILKKEDVTISKRGTLKLTPAGRKRGTLKLTPAGRKHHVNSKKWEDIMEKLSHLRRL